MMGLDALKKQFYMQIFLVHSSQWRLDGNPYWNAQSVNLGIS